MRILNEADDKPMDRVTLFLINEMLADPIGHDHEHVSSDDYRKEVTVCIYSPDSPNQFDERSKRLILEDK